MQNDSKCPMTQTINDLEYKNTQNVKLIKRERTLNAKLKIALNV